jgi:hypothetical protein
MVNNTQLASFQYLLNPLDDPPRIFHVPVKHHNFWNANAFKKGAAEPRTALQVFRNLWSCAISSDMHDG